MYNYKKDLFFSAQDLEALIIEVKYFVAMPVSFYFQKYIHF